MADIERLKKLIKIFENRLKTEKTVYSLDGNYYKNPSVYFLFKDILEMARKCMPDDETFFINSLNHLDRYSETYLLEKFLKTTLSYTKDLIKLYEETETLKSEGKLFLSAREKYKMAEKSFGIDDKPAVFSNLTTALELAIKEKLEIPATIPNIHIRAILKFFVKKKILPRYSKQILKKIPDLRNPSIHQGFNPSRKDCIDAIKSVDEFLSKLETKKIHKKIIEEAINLI